MSTAEARQSTGEAPPLQMRVAVAPALARQPGWYREFHCATRRAGRLLRGALGRDLRLRDRVTWSGVRDSEGLAELLARLVGGIGHDGADIVVGLVPRSTSRRRADPIMRDRGEASYAQGYVILRAAAPLCEADRLLAHEIAHVFGGVHRRGSGNLMDPDVPGTRVDELNAALFDLHRDRLVRAQAPPLGGEIGKIPIFQIFTVRGGPESISPPSETRDRRIRVRVGRERSLHDLSLPTGGRVIDQDSGFEKLLDVLAFVLGSERWV